MKRFVIAAASLVLLSSASPSYAQSGQALYTGSFTCSDASFRTDWKVSKGLEGGIAATVFYQRKGEQRVNWIDVYENKEQVGSRLVDKNGVPRLSVSPSEDGLSVRWINSGIGYNCDEGFKVQKTEHPKLRYDALFALLEVESPSPEQVSQVSELLDTAPIIYTLPELDQQTYAQRLHELRASYWARYSEQVSAKISLAALTTAEDRQAFSKSVKSALSRSLIAELGDSWYKRVYAVMQENADRHAIDDIAAVRDLFSAGQGFCERLNEISSSPYDDNLNMVELSAGLPIDYWTRINAEDALKLLRACDKNRFADKLAQSWPEIEQRQSQLQPLIDEHKRLLTLPVTSDAFLENPDLKANDDVKDNTSSAALYDRFLGNILDPRRNELAQAAFIDLKENTSAEALADEKTRVKVKAMCSAMERLYKLPQEKLSAIAEICNKADDIVEVLRCDAVAADTGASADLLNSTIDVYNNSDTSLKDIVCKMDHHGQKITLETSGFLMWKKQHLNLRNTRRDKDEEPLKFILRPSEKTANWVLTTEDAETKTILQDEQVEVEKLTACWSQSPSCPYR